MTLEETNTTPASLHEETAAAAEEAEEPAATSAAPEHEAAADTTPAAAAATEADDSDATTAAAEEAAGAVVTAAAPEDNEVTHEESVDLEATTQSDVTTGVDDVTTAAQQPAQPGESWLLYFFMFSICFPSALDYGVFGCSGSLAIKLI